MSGAIPTLRTPRLLLEAHRRDDHDDLAAMWADPATVHYIGKPCSRQESWFRLLRYRGLWAVLGYGYWAVRERATGRYVGDVGFGDMRRDTEPPLDAVPEAGWVLAAWAHGRGFATEATAAAFDWMDRSGGHRRTICIMAPDHAGSLKVARRNGFVDAGTVRMNGAATLLLERFAQAKGDVS